MPKRKAPSAGEDNEVAGPSVKREPVESVVKSGDDDLVDVLREGGAVGMSSQELNTRTPHMDAHTRHQLVNRLLKMGRIEMHKLGNDILFKVVSEEEALKRVAGVSAEEQLVLDSIGESHTTGIWIRDLRTKTGLGEAALKKSLKILETMKLVKSVKSAGAARKRVYMLFDLEPDTSVVGGSLYAEGDLDAVFVEMITEQCRKLLLSRAELAEQNNKVKPYTAAYVGVRDVLEHINDLRISKVPLTIKDVERVLDTIVYDGEAERAVNVVSVTSVSSVQYRHVRSLSSLMKAGQAVTSVPCVFCPIASDCRPGARTIAPARCRHFKEWIAF